jgi:hypothetical protein
MRKFFLFLINYYVINIYGKSRYVSTILYLGTRCEWSASRYCRFTFEDRPSGTHWLGGWVGPRDGLDFVEKRKFLPLPEANPSRPACSHSLCRLSHPGSPYSYIIFQEASLCTLASWLNSNAPNKAGAPTNSTEFFMYLSFPPSKCWDSNSMVPLPVQLFDTVHIAWANDNFVIYFYSPQISSWCDILRLRVHCFSWMFIL